MSPQKLFKNWSLSLQKYSCSFTHTLSYNLSGCCFQFSPVLYWISNVSNTTCSGPCVASHFPERSRYDSHGLPGKNLDTEIGSQCFFNKEVIEPRSILIEQKCFETVALLGNPNLKTFDLTEMCGSTGPPGPTWFLESPSPNVHSSWLVDVDPLCY